MMANKFEEKTAEFQTRNGVIEVSGILSDGAMFCVSVYVRENKKYDFTVDPIDGILVDMTENETEKEKEAVARFMDRINNQTYLYKGNDEEIFSTIIFVLHMEEMRNCGIVSGIDE